jgi:hypothetical protein
MTSSVRPGPEILRPGPGDYKKPSEENLHARIYEGSAEKPLLPHGIRFLGEIDTKG